MKINLLGQIHIWFKSVWGGAGVVFDTLHESLGTFVGRAKEVQILRERATVLR